MTSKLFLCEHLGYTRTEKKVRLESPGGEISELIVPCIRFLNLGLGLKELKNDKTNSILLHPRKP